MKKIILTQGQFAIVDDKNYEWLSKYKWYAHWSPCIKSFYAVRNGKKVKGKQASIKMHREILGLKYGDKRQADHIDHNTLDNRESNLRIVTPQQNKCNRRNVKGFQFDNQANRYQAYITIDRKKKHLGMFATPEEAHNAYLKAKKKYHKI